MLLKFIKVKGPGIGASTVEKNLFENFILTKELIKRKNWVQRAKRRTKEELLF